MRPCATGFVLNEINGLYGWVKRLLGFSAWCRGPRAQPPAGVFGQSANGRACFRVTLRAFFDKGRRLVVRTL